MRVVECVVLGILVQPLLCGGVAAVPGDAPGGGGGGQTQNSNKPPAPPLPKRKYILIITL